jgi:hypothetical protein
MIRSGLVSVTFRKLAPRQIVDLVSQAGLDGIEWGGDVHVPHGDLARAQEVAAMTVDAGLRVASYGSYYRVGHETELQFETVLETARALGAPSIRVWAGDLDSADAGAAYWDHVVSESRRAGDLAAAAGLRVSFELHGGSLTDTYASALRLIERIAHARVGMYWQPKIDCPVEANVDGLRSLLPWLTNAHVFHWGPTTQDRHPLAEGEGDWRRYLDIIGRADDRYALMEFVPGDEPAAFLRDAAVLKGWLG